MGSVEKFLADARARHLKEPSLRKYELFLKKQQLPYCQAHGIVRMRQLTIDVLRDFRASWNFSPITQAKKLDNLKGFLRFAESADWMKPIPKNALNRRRAPRRRRCRSPARSAMRSSMPATSSGAHPGVGSCP